MSLVSANIKWWQELPNSKDSITMPTEEENNAATPQYITSNDLIGVKFQHSHGMSPTYHKLSRNFGGIVRYCSPHPLIHERLVKSR